MSGKDTVMDKCQKNISQKEPHSKTSLLLFNFSKLKQNANITLSDYNLFNFNFSTKDLFDFNPKKENPKKNNSEYLNENMNLNLIKNLNIELPSSEKICEEKFSKEFIDNYETSFANFCEIDKELFIKAFVNKSYIPRLDKFGDIKISIKTLLDILKSYSQFLKLKIRRRFTKKYKKKKMFKTMKNSGYGINNPNLNKEGLKLLSLKKNLKISVKRSNTNDDSIINSKEKENIQEGNLNYNSNNNFLNSINNILSNDCIFSNNLFKTSLFNLQPPSNNYIRNTENFFSFSLHDQNYFNNLNNLNQTQATNNQNTQLLNKKRNFTPYMPYTPYINSQNQNPNQNQNLNLNNKLNNPNLNIMTPLYNQMISPQILGCNKDFLTPSSIPFPPGELISPNIANDNFNFNNLRNPYCFGNIINHSPLAINNNINTNFIFFNTPNNNKNENNANNINLNENLIMSPNLINNSMKK